MNRTPEEIAGMEEVYARQSGGDALQFDIPPHDMPRSVLTFINAVLKENGLKEYRVGTMMTILLLGKNEGRYMKKILIHTISYDIVVSPTWDGWTSEFSWAADTHDNVKADLRA